MRVLVCGSRDYDDRNRLFHVLWHEHGRRQFKLIIEGGARGADRLARFWADAANVRIETYEAEWEKFGKSAGYRRNQRMLDEGKPDLVIAFYSSKEKSPGTSMMVRIARAAGVEVQEVEPV